MLQCIFNNVLPKLLPKLLFAILRQDMWSGYCLERSKGGLLVANTRVIFCFMIWVKFTYFQLVKINFGALILWKE